MGLIHWREAQRKRSRAESGQTAGAREKCVLCGGETPYLRTVPIDRREGYLEGACLLYTSPSPRDLSTSRMPSSA